MNEIDEPQGFRHTHNRLNINQNSQNLMTFITSKLRPKLKQHIIVARGNKRIDYRLSYNFYTTYYDNVEIRKIDYEHTYAMAIAILIGHTISFDNVRSFAQLRHPIL